MKTHKIYIPIYKQSIRVIRFTDHAKIARKFPDIDFGNPDYNAACFRHDGKMWAVFEKGVSVEVIAHECWHLAHFTMEAAGIELDYDNQEPGAYIMGYIFEQVYNILK